MFFSKNLKKLIKKLRINKKIILFKEGVISIYNDTFLNNGNTYFLIKFNDYFILYRKKVDGNKIENDIITIFNEDWRLFSVIVKI